MNNNRWFKIEIKRTAEIAPRHPLKNEKLRSIGLFSACFSRAEGLSRAQRQPLDRNLTVDISLGEVLATLVTRISRADFRPTRNELRWLFPALPRGAHWLVRFHVSCFVRANLILKHLIRWFRRSVFHFGILRYFYWIVNYFKLN